MSFTDMAALQRPLQPAIKAEEIAFLAYRLDILSEWPPSERKDTLITATEQRLRSLGFCTEPPRGFRP